MYGISHDYHFNANPSLLNYVPYCCVCDNNLTYNYISKNSYNFTVPSCSFCFLLAIVDVVSTIHYNMYKESYHIQSINIIIIKLEY